MKKKIFSALLMGVFVMASMSMFVSCKDYDDDIDGLNLSQADLLSKIEALESSINANQTTMSEQLAAAQKKADEALSAAQANGQDITNLKSLIDAAKTAAADAGKQAAAAEVAANEANEKAAVASEDAASAQKAAEQAKEAAEQAKADAQEALEKAKEALEDAQQGASSADVKKALDDAKSALDKATSLETRVSQLETLTSGLEQLKQDVANAVTKEEFDAYKKSVENYQAYFDNLFAMVTSVELYGTFNGAGLTIGAPVGLDLMHGNVLTDYTFGKESGADSKPLIDYVKGTDIKADAGLLLRVNPVNAVLSLDDKNCNIKIVNSKGESMEDYVDVVGVERYTDLITRSSDPINTGLWKVNYEFKEGVDMDAFKKAVENDGDDVLFAVAVNNTDTIQSDRYVVSTFDLTLSDEDFVADGEMKFTVDTYELKDLQNRNVDGSDKAWKNGKTATSATDDNTVSEANRSGGKLVSAEINKDITIKMEGKGVEYYYVTLDKDYANADDPSELNAWNSYSYEGLLTTVKASEDLKFKVTSAQANGDIIGFRVFAVNYDGTLVDPDGSAFYVSFGDAPVTQTINAELDAKAAGLNSVVVKLPEGFKASTDALAGTFAQSDFDKDGKKSLPAAGISYQLLDKEDAQTTVSNWNKAKYIKISFNDVQNFLDGETFTVVIKAKDAENVHEVNVLTLNVTKVMPTQYEGVAFKAGQLTKSGVYTCYVDPDDTTSPVWSTASNYGYKSLGNAVTGMDDANFEWVFANAARGNDNKVGDLTVIGTGVNDYLLKVAKEFIKNDTEHETAVNYIYRGISLVQKENGGIQTLVKVNDYRVPVKDLQFKTIFACALDNSVQSYGWEQKNTTSGKEDVNFIVYGSNKLGGDYLTADDKLTDFIVAKNSYDSSFGGSWNDSWFIEVEAELLSVGTGKADYYDVQYDETNHDFKFEPKSGTTNPIDDVKSELLIKAKDAFGHTNTYKLDFEVRKR